MSSERRPKKNVVARITILTAVFAAALFVIVYLSQMFYRPEHSEAADEKIYDKYYVIITDEYKSSFWQSVCEGAAKEAAAQNAYVELLGTSLTETHTTEELMEMAIASGVDGILLCGNGSPELSVRINEAAQKNIPVVTINHDNPASRRISYVGVSGYNIGSEYGRQIISVLNEKKRREAATAEGDTENANEDVREQIKVCILSDPEISTDQNLVVSGMRDVLNAEESEMDFSINALSVDDSNPFSVEESLRDLFMEGEEPDIIIALSELDTTSAYQAVVDYNKVGSVYILGSYDSKKILNAISRNVVFSTITVDTEELGKYGFEALCEYEETGNTSEYFAADIILIDKSNIAEYMKEKEETDEP